MVSAALQNVSDLHVSDFHIRHLQKKALTARMQRRITCLVSLLVDLLG